MIESSKHGRRATGKVDIQTLVRSSAITDWERFGFYRIRADISYITHT